MLVIEYQKLLDKRNKGYYKEGDVWKCKKCHNEVQALITRVPLHDGYSLMGVHGGYGSTTQIEIPYCPTCGEEPFDVDCIDV